MVVHHSGTKDKFNYKGFKFKCWRCKLAPQAAPPTSSSTSPHGRNGLPTNVVSTTVQSKKSRQSTTQRPTCKEEQCKFQFPVFFCKVREMFFVRQHAGGNLVHNGHATINPQIMQLGAGFFDDDAIQLAKKLLADNAPPSIVDVVIHCMSDQNMSRKAIQKLRESGIQEKHGFATDNSESVATRALKVLDNDNIQFCYITGRFQDASDIVTVKSVSMRGSKHQVQEDSINVKANGMCERSEFVKETIRGLTLGTKLVFLILHSVSFCTNNHYCCMITIRQWGASIGCCMDNKGRPDVP